MTNDARMAVLETTVTHIYDALKQLDRRLDERFDNIDKKFDAIDKKFEAVDRKFERIGEQFDSFQKEVHTDLRDMNNRLWFNFFWVVGGFIGILSLIARSFHWV